MIIIFNLLLVFLVLLIAYWWANQGVFSALLHLVCVVVAGAIALALWEPVTTGLLLRGNAFDDYAWGVSLVGLFGVSLLVLRVAMDKIVVGNVNMPTWVNLAFGFPLGLASGVLTMGMVVIGTGFIQSHQEVVGYSGYGRNPRTAEVTRVGPGMWLPVHRWTNEFYNYLSAGSLYPTFNDTPLIQYYPELYKQASLVRDSYEMGRGKLSLLPDAASVKQVQVDEPSNRHAVTVEFGALARDFGQQLTLSRSQIRLICSASGMTKPMVVHPDAWTQETVDRPNARFMFDNVTHYVTSVPGRESATVVLEFPVPAGHTPRFIQVRGTRYRLPQAVPVQPGTLGSGIAQAVSPQSSQPMMSGSAPSIQSLIRVSNDLRPFSVSSNQLPGTMKHVDRYLTEGVATHRGDGSRPTRALMIRGVEEPAGTRTVQLDVSRGTAADIFGDLRLRVGDRAPLALVDSAGNAYSPIGYIHEGRDGTTVRLDPARFLRTAEDLPVLPSAGSDKLRLLFRVTAGSTIVGFRYGDVTVGTCNLAVTAN